MARVFEEDFRHRAAVLHGFAGVFVDVLPCDQCVFLRVQVAARDCEVEERRVEKLFSALRDGVVLEADKDVV